MACSSFYLSTRSGASRTLLILHPWFLGAERVTIRLLCRSTPASGLLLSANRVKVGRGRGAPVERREKSVRLKRIVFSAEVRRPSDWAERSTLYVQPSTLLLSCPCRMLGKKAARQLARHARVRQARQRASHPTPLPCSSPSALFSPD